MNTDTPVLSGSTEAFRELAETAQRYLDLLYACDPDLVDGVFEPGARLCTLDQGGLVYRSVAEYKEVLRGRTPPRAVQAAREDQLLSLDLASPTLGLIKVKMRINEMVFIDYLTLIKQKAGWRIVAKTYHRLSDATA